MAIGSAHASGASQVSAASSAQLFAGSTVANSEVANSAVTNSAVSNSVVTSNLLGTRTVAPVAPPVVVPLVVKPAPVAKARQAAVMFRGGTQYVIAGAELCSTGFAVVSATGQDGFITAGHCGTAGAAVATPSGTQMGTFVASSFPGTDYAWVASNPRFAGESSVSTHNGHVTAVRGAAPAAVGAPVCMSGQSSGWHCGTIIAVDQTVEYDQGYVSGLTETTICSDAGDSGGAFISGDQAQGVTSGGVGDCSSHGVTYFQPVAPILSTYGLALKTS